MRRDLGFHSDLEALTVARILVLLSYQRVVLGWILGIDGAVAVRSLAGCSSCSVVGDPVRLLHPRFCRFALNASALDFVGVVPGILGENSEVCVRLFRQLLPD